MIGPYRIIGVLGRGGAETLYLAEDQGGREFVLQVLEELTGTRGQDIARAVERLREVHSPSVPEIIDADLTGPQPFIATEYQPGVPLLEIVTRSGPLRRESLLQVARELAEGIAAMHRAGVLHRAIMPDNIIMDQDQPVLIDFSLAGPSEPEGPPALPDNAIQVTGTPGHLAPETLTGDPVGPSADVFSWAATIAYAATGREPFGTGYIEAIFDRVVSGEPDLDGIPASLRALLHQSLAKNPLDRPPPDELADAVANLSSGYTRLPAPQ